MASPDFQIFKPRKNIMLHIFYEQKSEKKEDEKKNKHGLTIKNSFSVSIIHNAPMGDHFSFIISS